MSQENDRIRLAEAMGWTKSHNLADYHRPCWRHPDPELHGYQYRSAADLPDPFTDANDAWAVHEYFMASEQAEEYKDMLFGVVVRTNHLYSRAQDVTPWHWTKAALKVIDNNRVHYEEWGEGHFDD